MKVVCKTVSGANAEIEVEPADTLSVMKVRSLRRRRGCEHFTCRSEGSPLCSLCCVEPGVLERSSRDSGPDLLIRTLRAV